MDQTSKPLHTQDLQWMPLGPGVWARPLRFSGEERTLQLKVEPGITIGRLHAFHVSGSRRLGDGEIAGPGAYVFEPAGNEDSWACIGDEPCVVQINLSGRVEYVDEHGELISYTDTPKLREQYLA